MGKRSLVLAFLIIMTSASVFAQEVANLPDEIRSPKDLVRWYANEFEYRMEMMDDWQSPAETVDARKGDCEDFAYLSHAALKDLGLESNVYLLNFKGIKTKHAVCIFKEKDGTYSIISNKEMYETGESDVQQAVKRYYPDCSGITIAKNGR